MVALSTYLPTINFKNEVIVALDREGLSTTDDLLDLDEDDVENLFKVIKAPGGQVLNPAYVPPGGTPAIATRGAATAAAPAVVPAIYIPQHIPAVGINVPYLNTKHMVQLVYYMQYLETVQRKFVSVLVTKTELKRIFAQKSVVEKEEDLQIPDKITNVKRIRDTIDDIIAYLERKRGLKGAPLAYVIRKKEWHDATRTPPSLPPGPFDSIDTEQIARGRLEGDTFNTDNSAVWEVIREVFFKTSQWAWIMQFRKAKDGRKAFLSIMSHYMGDGASSVIVTDATSNLEKLYFNGNRRGYTFGNFCNEILQN